MGAQRLDLLRHGDTTLRPHEAWWHNAEPLRDGDTTLSPVRHGDTMPTPHKARRDNADFVVSRFGPAVRRQAGKRKDFGSNPLRLSFLFKKVVVCGHCLNCDFVHQFLLKH